ncbi:MAG TPA: trehalose-phosphatase [Terriglobales bacterium]|jgi:trehalose 6-phosphate phosphatase|nr:trehalose-phosphatase [Terriglobales bacterium]
MRNSGRVLLTGDEEHVVVPHGHTNQSQQFLNAVVQATLSTLLLDYDGTLAPFCVNRQQAFPYPGMTSLLQEIIANGRTRVVIITGRSAHEVLPLLAVHPSPEIWGCHGLERLRPDGTCETPHVEEPVLRALADADRWLRHQGLHNRTEFKTGSVAIHWRGLDDAMAAEARGEVLLGWFPIAQSTPMDLLEFDGGIEMRMPGRDKGDAVCTILDEIGPEAPVAYLGDDTTDERAFPRSRYPGPNRAGSSRMAQNLGCPVDQAARGSAGFSDMVATSLS